MNSEGAFPRIETEIKYHGTQHPEHHIKSEGGMTLRDYFAAKAMQAITANYKHLTDSSLAQESYKLADAMLAERNKEKEA